MQNNISNITTTIKGNELLVDAKSFLKIFKSGSVFVSKFKDTFPTIETENIPRQPMWVNIESVSEIFDKFKNNEIIDTQFKLSDFLNGAYDWAYSMGLTDYKSQSKIAAEEEEKAKKIKEEHSELLHLREVVANIKEKEKVGINPAIQFLNDVWFPVSMSLVFASVIGSFSYEILSETMGMAPIMNVLLAIVYVLFPILTSIRQYNFEVMGEKISPLTIVMIADMIFTAYHVGWLHGDGYEPKLEMHWILKMVYILIIPIFQKATNDMILKIRASYLNKGWLPKV